ncbi:MAG: caspase family protein [Saprospiraceae bacterium]|nr:caspase family protein [Saprospiraceae bacterium]
MIGISDYKDKDIPDLRYADRDAEAFAEWLKSPAGGNVPEDNIRLLTNEKATADAIKVELYDLIDACKEGDKVVIYFSGHGDVDSKLLSQQGFLLTYNTKASMYRIAAVEIDYLQDVVSTLSIKNNVNVLLITDACRAGLLAGSNINGVQLTANNLAKQIANESKILSCQQNEFSHEGPQWGGGRGVFSWFLLKGLTGLADKNGDGKVSLKEIDQYLDDVVPAETPEMLQTPVTVGDRNTTITLVDPRSLAALQELENAQGASLHKITLKGLEEEVLAKADSATRRQYLDFKKALANNLLLEPSGTCAWDLFQLLALNKQVAPLHRLMRNNLAVAILDEVQEALNALLSDDPYEVNQWRFNSGKYARYPILVQRAIDLLGTEHPMYHSLEAKRLFFEAYGITHYGYGASGEQGPDSLKQLAREKLYQALQFDTISPYIYYLLGNMYLGTFQEDSLKYYYGKAMELSPTWVLPFLELTWDYLDTYRNFDEAGKYIHRAVALRPNSYQALEILAWWHQRYNRIDSVETICHQMRLLRPDLISDYVALWCADEMITRNYDRAIDYNKKACEVNATPLFCPYPLFRSRRFEEAFQQIAREQSTHELGFADWAFAGHYLNIQDWYRADSLFRKLIKSTPSQSDRAVSIAILGKIQIQIGRLDTAEVILQSSLSMLKTPHSYQGFSLAWLGVIAQKRGLHAQAESYFHKAVTLHPELWNFDGLQDGTEIHVLYGDFLADQNRFPEAEEKYQKSIEMDPGNYIGYYAMARFYSRQGKKSEALDQLEKALDRYYPVPEPILKEPLFKKIRKTKRFKALMLKHFPEM